MFLERYRRDRDPVDLATARRLLALGRRPGGRAVGRERSAGRSPESAGAWTASGFELGVAGIAWVNLQAARIDRRRRLPRARATAPEAGCGASPSAAASGRSCPAMPGLRQHVGLDSGARGDRLGARGPRPRGHRHGREPRRRAVGARRAPRRGAPRPARGVLVREPDRRTVDGCAPSRPGTGAPPESPRSRLGSPAGPG